jgi:aryl-alcohol dehydrogenase-like predicted oxidoreductase
MRSWSEVDRSQGPRLPPVRLRAQPRCETVAGLWAVQDRAKPKQAEDSSWVRTQRWGQTLPVQFERLGRAGPEISRVGFGAWAIGGPSRFGWGSVDDADSIDAIRHAIEQGVNWVDTAAFYGRGHSEEVVGKAVSPWRTGDEVLVFTKCGLRWDPGSDPDTPPTNDLRPESIRYEVDQSLGRLGLERIDLYQFHWPDRLGTRVEDSWATMQELVTEGKVRWAGVSNFDVGLLERCEARAHVDSVQPQLNLIERDALAEVIPWAATHGTGVLAYSPMASGLLTGRFSKQRAAALPADDWRRDAPQFQEPALSRNLDLVQRLEAVARGLRATLPEVVTAWTLAVPGVTAAIVGARTAEQVDGWIGAADVDLSEDDLRSIADALRASGAGTGPAGPAATS